MMEQILRPIRKDIERFEERLELALRSDVDLVDQVVRYLASVKGKRLRPSLALLTSKMLGAASEDVLDAAVAVELIHTATLVHDDVVDCAELRRGASSVNSLWNDRISVLIGDFLFSRAFSILVRVGSEEVLRVMSGATERIARGELLQIERAGELDLTEDLYFSIIGDKTASLMSAACEVGAILSGAHPDRVERMVQFGEDLGLAFQITDDVLDFVGRVEITGKPVGRDMRDRKLTLPLIRALSVCENGERERIRSRMLSAPAGEQVFEEILGFVERYEGVRHARDRAKEFSERAYCQIESLEPSEARDALLEMALSMAKRQR